MKKFLKYFGIIMLVLLLVVVGVGFKMYKDVKDAADEIYTPIGDGDNTKVVEKIQKKEPISVLFLGVDERKGDRGRSDTMIVMTVNPNNNTSKMVSIPRDTYTDIIGYGIKDKINHAYAFGGIKMSKDTVEELLDIEIDYVAKINMEGFKDIIDIVGPINVNNNLDFSYGGSDFPVGSLTLNGKDAMNYVQMRKNDPAGDFGRQNRQKQVIQGLIKKAASVNTVMNYNDILNVMTTHVQANVTLDDIMKLQKNYKNSFDNIEQLSLAKGSSMRIDGIYYYDLNDEELATVKQSLKEHIQ